MQSGEEWLLNRTGGLGGSDASVVLGISPYKSRLELWEEKVNRVVIKKDNPDLHWGKKLEPFIIEEYIELTKREVRTGCFYEYENLRSQKYPWMTANLDAVIIDEEQGKGVLECKTKSAYVKWEKEIPDYYYAQIQHYLAVTDYKWASFTVLDFGKKELTWKDVDRDKPYIKNLIAEEKKFWQLVVDQIPPGVESSQSCNTFLKNKYIIGDPCKQIDLQNNNSASNWAHHLLQIKKEMKLLEEHELECKNNLMNLIGNAEKAIGNDYQITWKSPKDKLVFNVDLFREKHPDLYEEFIEKESQSRRFNIKLLGGE